MRSNSCVFPLFPHDQVFPPCYGQPGTEKSLTWNIVCHCRGVALLQNPNGFPKSPHQILPRTPVPAVPTTHMCNLELDRSCGQVAGLVAQPGPAAWTSWLPLGCRALLCSGMYSELAAFHGTGFNNGTQGLFA